MEQDEDAEFLLDQRELTDYTSGTPTQIMTKYSNGDIIMVLPQPVTICWAGYFKTYNSLKEIAEKTDRNLCSYLEMRSEIVPVPDFSLDDKTLAKSNIKFSNMFNDYDYLTEAERDEACQLIKFDIQAPEEYDFSIEEIMKTIVTKGENDGLKIMIRTYPGDMAHPNECYPWLVRQNYRHRVYYYSYRIFRYEISKPVFEQYLTGGVHKL